MDAINDNFENLMAEAERLAKQIGERFTPIRRHVYKSLIGAPQPLGAYEILDCLLYTSPSPRDKRQSRMPSSA